MRYITKGKKGAASFNVDQLGEWMLLSPEDPKMSVLVSGVLGVGGAVKLYYSQFNNPGISAADVAAGNVAVLATINTLGNTFVDMTGGYFAVAIETGDGSTELTVDVNFII